MSVFARNSSLGGRASGTREAMTLAVNNQSLAAELSRVKGEKKKAEEREAALQTEVLGLRAERTEQRRLLADIAKAVEGQQAQLDSVKASIAALARTMSPQDPPASPTGPGAEWRRRMSSVEMHRARSLLPPAVDPDDLSPIVEVRTPLQETNVTRRRTPPLLPQKDLDREEEGVMEEEEEEEEEETEETRARSHSPTPPPLKISRPSSQARQTTSQSPPTQSPKAAQPSHHKPSTSPAVEEPPKPAKPAKRTSKAQTKPVEEEDPSKLAKPAKRIPGAKAKTSTAPLEEEEPAKTAKPTKRTPKAQSKAKPTTTRDSTPEEVAPPPAAKPPKPIAAEKEAGKAAEKAPSRPTSAEPPAETEQDAADPAPFDDSAFPTEEAKLTPRTPVAVPESPPPKPVKATGRTRSKPKKVATPLVEEPVRPRRSRQPVSYAEPSLAVKMRRPN